MSGREHFLRRYEELGWKFREAKLKQSIRINMINARGKDIVKRLEARGIELEKTSFLERGYWVHRSAFSIGATSEYLLGLYSIQEAAAQIPATLFSSLRGKTVLDGCAAPGGKTVQLADLMGNSGTIVALDVRKRRLRALTNHLERCHVKNTIVYQMDAKRASQLNIKFDRILLDVPCSGNFITDHNWFRKRTAEDVEKNAKFQKGFLKEAANLLEEDGEIIYSTCSLEPEEDELNVEWAIKTLDLRTEKIDCYGEKALTNVFGLNIDKSIENCRRIWPSQTQGFFICKLKREVHDP
jgi:NOL1/NOP2/sun family putative RNA methylase